MRKVISFIQRNKKKLILVAAFVISLTADLIFPGAGVAIDLLFLLWELWQLY
ncbi:hypothetical protein [Mastigocoleus sp. MO_188.B34]|uniref:hypothetical protein n=1 Tax=Mastigocoleus sp. MO_188.B34 TaxID=3036635 RepID=UPI0026349021|nr:hypothetical protein [Mastigocoleus sp. MO_188.B34]MDJ0694829.1 hypothetical protein [Mastigocoleus sp. MO_188.B34]